MNKLLKTQTIITLLGVTFFLLSTSTKIFGQNENNTNTEFKQYKGKILDIETKSALVSVNISIHSTNIGTVTNTEGDFLLKVPKIHTDKNIKISFLGYSNKTVSLSELEKSNKIFLNKTATKLAEVNIETLKNVDDLIKEVFQKKDKNYLDNHAVMTAFYRETIKKRNKNVSLSEAIVSIYKTRKNTDYSKLDTLAFKLQGGPFNTLFVDIMKYPEYIFTEETIPNYDFNFSHSTKVNNTIVYVINFKQKEAIKDLLYEGELLIDYENKILTSATYSLNLSNKNDAANWFIKQKPSRSTVLPTKATYQVNYNEKNGKWYYGYSNLALDFKVNWKNKLFNSNYSMSCEMAVTDWKENTTKETPKFKERIKSSVVMADYSAGFSDPDFWGKHNIIEPDKSIERAIKKIQRQLDN